MPSILSGPLFDASVAAVERIYSIIPPPSPPSNGAEELVREGWEQAQDYATEAFDKATGFLITLEGLTNELGDLPDISVDLGAITSQLIPYVSPPTPNEPGNMELTIPDAPVRPDLDILDGAIATLQEWVSGVSTGIAPYVEDQIWERARAREHALTQRKVMAVRTDAARLGFAKPPGAMYVAMAEALQEQANKDSDLSRQVAVEQAKLEQTNRHFALTTITQVAGEIIRIYAADMQAFISRVEAEVRRAMGEAQIYESRTRAYVSQVQGATSATESSAKVYEAESRVVVASAGIRIEVLKANVQKMIAQLNTLVEIAKGGAQVSAQLAASALSAVNLSGGISAQTSESRTASASNSSSRSISSSGSFNESHNFNHDTD